MPAQIDRSAIRQMVEDHWRSMLSSIHQTKNPGSRPLVFSERVEAIAVLMPQDEAEAFRKVVEEERELLADDYDRDPIELKRRLGFRVSDLQAVNQTAPAKFPAGALFLVGAIVFSALVTLFLISN